MDEQKIELPAFEDCTIHLVADRVWGEPAENGITVGPVQHGPVPLHVSLKDRVVAFIRKLIFGHTFVPGANFVIKRVVDGREIPL
jgi:hypothetical protein